MYCKVCGKHLYEHVDFRNLFKWNYYWHIDCDKYLNKEWDYEVIPIDNNEIHFYYLFDKIQPLINDDFVILLNGNNLFKIMEDSVKWSMIIYYELSTFDLMDELSMYLLYSLSKETIVFIGIYPVN